MFGPAQQQATMPMTNNLTSDVVSMTADKSKGATAGHWHGLREGNTQVQHICQLQEDLAYWMKHQARICHTFATHKAAEEWLRTGDDEDHVMWMGLKNNQWSRCVTRNLKELLTLINNGYHHVQTFTTEVQAAKWVSEADDVGGPEVEITGVCHGNVTAERMTHPSHPGNLTSSATPEMATQPWYGLIESSHTRVICNTMFE